MYTVIQFFYITIRNIKTNFLLEMTASTYKRFSKMVKAVSLSSRIRLQWTYPKKKRNLKL